MASENDDFMPTGMGKSKNEVSQEFSETAQDSIQEVSQDKSNEVVEVEVPDMIKEDNPHPQLRPGYDTSDVDAEHFEIKEQRDREKYSQQQDAFDQIDEQLGRDTEKEKTYDKDLDSFEKIDKESSLSERFNSRSQGWEL
ncbi:hypothetical protein [Aliikangiella maris]|uniref:Uncharacterized protein n=2 Tax=Aliikangiella maris TaxID=3162458 RepID=A0ABV3MSN8_9GAMM